MNDKVIPCVYLCWTASQCLLLHKEVCFMLSVIHFVCCGMDIHKKFAVATIAITDYCDVTSYIKRRFTTFNSDLKALKNDP